MEKQRTNSIINVRQQRFNKRITADTSDESDVENSVYLAGSNNHNHINNHDSSNNNTNNRLGRTRATYREQRLIRTNNALNSLSSAPMRENPPLQLFYDNLKTNQKSTESSILARNAKTNHVHEKRALFETFKRQSIVTDSKVIKTALRIRENSTSSNDIALPSTTYNSNHTSRLEQRKEFNSPVIATGCCNDEKNDATDASRDADSKSFGNYDNLQHVWEGLQTEKNDGNDSPTQPAVWLTKLCEGLPTSPPKCGSLPRSFQISPNSQQPSLTKSRFLQRDGKPMSERPFTIASDKPAEINLEDMERYASTCQPEGRIAKFPMPASTSSSSSSTFFCSFEDTTLSDAYSDVRVSANGASIHPDHKIYRVNGGSTIFKSVLSKAGSRLQSLRNTMSTETLECSDELDRTRYFPSLSVGKCQLKRRNKSKHAKESSSDVEELMGCASNQREDQRVPLLYYKQGSSSLGARIAQSDYADPTILFAENKRNQISSTVDQSKKTESAGREHEEEDKDTTERRESETDSFYERCFETIENYVDADVDEAFRDSAIFSDVDEVFVTQQPSSTVTTISSATVKAKVAPPIPAKKKQETSSLMSRYKPNVAQKPDYLRVKSMFMKGNSIGDAEIVVDNVTARLSPSNVYQSLGGSPQGACNRHVAEASGDDVSAGQSQAGWVRKIVGQLQGHVET